MTWPRLLQASQVQLCHNSFLVGSMLCLHRQLGVACCLVVFDSELLLILAQRRQFPE